MALTKVSTDGVKDDAITSGKIPANAVGASELADNAVDTNAIVDDAVNFNKISHIDSGRLLGRVSGGLGQIETPNASQVRTLLNVADGANQTTINNNADNRLITGSGTANTLNGESSATYNGTKLFLSGGSGNDQHIPMLELKHLNTAYSSGNGDGPAILLNGYYSNNEWSLAKIAASNAGGQYGSGYAGGLQFWVHPANGTQTAALIKGAEIIGDGTGACLYITDGDIKLASGHGIDFSATGGPTNGSGTSELLDDYEEGTWTPTYTQGSGNNTMSAATYNGANNGGTYQKIGRLVTFALRIQCASHTINNGQHVRITGLPFTSISNGTGTQAGAQFSYAQAVCASNNGYIPQLHIGNNSTTINFYTCNGNAYQSGDGNNNFNHTLHIHGQYITN